MSMNKYYTKGNAGNSEVVIKPMNNNELIEQLKAAILSECYSSEMSKNKEGCLKFSVRGGHLAINHILLEREMNPKILEEKSMGIEPKPLVGMSRSGLKTMLMILDSVLKETEPIDHATVLVHYSVEHNGDYSKGKLVVERGIHHPRF